MSDEAPQFRLIWLQPAAVAVIAPGTDGGVLSRGGSVVELVDVEDDVFVDAVELAELVVAGRAVEVVEDAEVVEDVELEVEEVDLVDQVDVEVELVEVELDVDELELELVEEVELEVVDEVELVIADVVEVEVELVEPVEVVDVVALGVVVVLGVARVVALTTLDGGTVPPSDRPHSVVVLRRTDQPAVAVRRQVAAGRRHPRERSPRVEAALDSVSDVPLGRGWAR